jgi:hypothetical protein
MVNNQDRFGLTCIGLMLLMWAFILTFAPRVAP